jgi:hypothetical protein
MAGHDEPTAADLERQRQAAALNHLLGEIGLTRPDDRSQWWNLVQHPALGNRTATQAWLAGETEAVRDLVERWYADSRAAARHVTEDGMLVAQVRERLEAFNQHYDRGRLHRTA